MSNQSKPQVGEQYKVNSWPVTIIRSDSAVVEYDVHERDGSMRKIGTNKKSQIGWQEDVANGEIVDF